MYDAVNAIGPKQYQPYLLKKRFGAKASVDAAVATAAYDVLFALVSDERGPAPFPTRATLLATLSTEYAASLDAVADGPFKKQGIAAGQAAADAILEARETTDGSVRLSGCPIQRLDAGGRSSIRLGSQSDPTPWVRRRRAVPHPELLAVPHRATARARHCPVRGGTQCRQGSGKGHGVHHPDG